MRRIASLRIVRLQRTTVTDTDWLRWSFDNSDDLTLTFDIIEDQPRLSFPVETLKYWAELSTYVQQF